MNSSEIVERLKQLQETFDAYFKQAPIETFNTTVRRITEEHNIWIENLNRTREQKHEELQNQLKTVIKLESEFEKIKEKINALPQDPTMGAMRNKLIDKQNALVSQHRELASAYKKEADDFNTKLEKSNREAAERKNYMEESRKNAKATFAKYESWLKNGGQEKFCHELNQLYGDMLQAKRRSPVDAEDLELHLKKARTLRHELGSYTKKEQEAVENGALVVSVSFTGDEKGLLSLETGSSVVSIIPEMVKILGIEEYVGEEIELYLPGNVRIKAQQLLIPDIAFDGNNANFVKAVILNHPIPGVDGGLGLSFLNRFNFRIERDHPRKLILEGDRLLPLTQKFDVFISYKTIDFKYAKEVYDFLLQSGYRPFLSEISLKEMSHNQFHEAIDSALAMVQHLIVVGSTHSNMMSPWVSEEWRRFDYLKKMGKKKGNLVPMRCNGMNVDDLPDALRLYEAISMDARDWKTTLINYLPMGAD